MKILIVLPVYNEDVILEKNVLILRDACQQLIGDEFRIVIANNASTDRTSKIATNLSLKFDNVDHLLIPQKGKGLAISTAWKTYNADYYGFMDADLATDLSALPEAIRCLKSDCDVVIGSRFHSKSQVTRSKLRRLISNSYRVFFKMFFPLKINDFPCGFKFVSKVVSDNITNLIKDYGFFWDTEMLVLANKQGYNIVEIPVIWSEIEDNNRKSHVNVLKTSINYMKQTIILRLRLFK